MTKIRFGEFELDPETLELSEDGSALQIGLQPVRLLAELVSRPGQLVSHEEVKRALWPVGAHVAASVGIHQYVRVLRRALRDDSDLPRFIENLPRRGYRFVGEVTRVDSPETPAGPRQVLAESSPVADRPAAGAVPTARSGRRRVRLGAALAAFALATTATLAHRYGGEPPQPAKPEPPSIVRFSIPLPPGAAVAAGPPSLALAPGGTDLLIAVEAGGSRHLLHHDLTTGGSRPIADSEGAEGPFFAPDGRRFGYLAGGDIRTGSLDSERTVPVVQAGPVTGAVWDPDDWIIYSAAPDYRLRRVAAAGGRPELLEIAAPEGSMGQLWPARLVGDLVVTDWPGGAADARIVRVRPGAPTVELVAGATSGRGSATGHLLYVRGGTLIASSFPSAEPGHGPGPGVTLATEVATDPLGGAHYATSENGVLAYVEGVQTPPTPTLYSPAGNPVALSLAGSGLSRLAPSPDGRRLLFTRGEGATMDLWVSRFDGSALSRLTVDRRIGFPMWRDDGRILFTESEGERELRELLPGGVEKRLAPARWIPRACAVDPGSQAILFTDAAPDGSGDDLWLLEPSGAVVALISGSRHELCCALSPDGRTLAWVSATPAESELWTAEFPRLASRSRIAGPSALQAFWHPREPILYWVEESGHLWTAERLSTGAVVRPRQLFRIPPHRSIAALADGTFLVLGAGAAVPATTVEIVLGWPSLFDEPSLRDPS